MSTYTYTCAWSDEESTYINNADSLFEIVDTVLDYYLWDDEQYTINELNGKFSITMTIGEELAEYEVKSCRYEVSDFLHIMARLEDRPDTFAISVVSKQQCCVQQNFKPATYWRAYFFDMVLN